MPQYLVRGMPRRKFVHRIATVKSLNLKEDCHGAIPVVANNGTFKRGLPSCGKPRYWNAVCQNIVKSSTSHYPSTVPLFDASFIFEERLDRCKSMRGGLFRPETIRYINGLSLSHYLVTLYLQLNQSKQEKLYAISVFTEIMHYFSMFVLNIFSLAPSSYTLSPL
jgi:hypothetical protein